MVSIIIPTHNRYKVLNDCINQLLNIDLYSQEDELIIIDNSLDIDSKCIDDMRGKCLGKIKFKYLNYSGRYQNDLSALRNKAFLISQGEIVIFLDDDAFVMTPNWIHIIHEIFNKDKNVVSLTGNLIEPGKVLVPWNGTDPVGKITAKGEIFGHFFKQPNDEIKIDHMRGCFMVFRRSLLEKVGIFDENMKGLYLEETELCVRVKRSGYDIVLTPRIIIDHRMATRGELISRATDNNRTIFNVAKNSFYFYLRHYRNKLEVWLSYVHNFYIPRLSRLLRNGDLRVFPAFFIFPISFLVSIILFVRGPKIPLCSKSQ